MTVSPRARRPWCGCGKSTAQQANGYGYSHFCDLYGEWRKTISATMRQTHVAGERLFVNPAPNAAM